MASTIFQLLAARGRVRRSAPARPGGAVLAFRRFASRARSTTIRTAAMALALLPLAVSLAAHDLSPLVELTARLVGDRLQVEVRLPAATIADANLRQDAAGRIVGGDVDTALAIVGRGIATDLAFEQDRNPLIPIDTTTTRTPDSLSAVVAMTYQVRGGGEGLSARLHAFQANGEVIKLRATYDPGSAPPRTFLIGGAAERVIFEPQTRESVQRFARLGTDVLLQGGALLFAVLCLAVPRRRPGALRQAVLWLLAAESAGALWSASPLAPALITSATADLLATTIAASALILITAQTLVNQESRWLSSLALILGAASGVGLGHAFLEQAAYAGAHSGAALLTFVGVLVLGQLWMVALAASVAGLLPRWGVPAVVAPLAVSIFVAHNALHRLAAAGAALATGDSRLLDHWLMILTLTWAAAILAIGLVGALRSGNWTPVAPGSALGDASR